MTIALICCIAFLGFCIKNYPKISYRAWYERCEKAEFTCQTCSERYSEKHCTGKCPSI